MTEQGGRYDVGFASVGVLEKLNRRDPDRPRSLSVLGVYQGAENGMATFLTNEGDTLSIPVGNVITRQSWEGTFVINRAQDGYPFAYKRV